MKDSKIKSFIDHIYGGLNMSWPVVISMALGTAVITALFLILPVFKGTSFERMGVYFEAWFFFAIIIMANCKKPLESALKTFVFFLVSQPLIYLLQVPFSYMGWGLFRYYGYWAMWTVLTFPMAYVGWYITKKNWLSALIMTPVLVFLASVAWSCGTACFRSFPDQLIALLFCIMQIVLYLIAFFSDIKKKAVGILAVIAAVVIFALSYGHSEVTTTIFLPEGIALSDEAAVVMEESDAISIEIASTGEDSMITVHAAIRGDTYFVIQDGEKKYELLLNIYDDESGHAQMKVEELQ